MATYSPILDTEIDAESPLTESLMTRLRDNPLALIQSTYSALTGTGYYPVPANVSLLRVILVSGGGGGGGGGNNTAAGGTGGNSGRVRIFMFSTTPLASIHYECGAGGTGAAGVNSSTPNTPTLGDDTTWDGGTWSTEGAPSYGNGGAGNTSGGAAASDAGISNVAYPSAIAEGGTGGGSYGPGGAGSPLVMPFWFSGLESYASQGGDGADGNAEQVGDNAALYGGGGGGGSTDNEPGAGAAGGNGSPGIIFVLPIG